MIKSLALELIQKYINGWKNNNLETILNCLSENCCITESHGPVYIGKSEIKDWFNFWLNANSHVEKWDLTSFYYLADETIAFIEWDFCCISNNIHYALSGISKVNFNQSKIESIHEYRMTKPGYRWEKDSLKSE